jgi:hypothetical protein
LFQKYVSIYIEHFFVFYATVNLFGAETRVAEIRLASKIWPVIDVQKKISLLLAIFGFQIYNNNYFQNNIKRGVYKEVKEVFTDTYKSQAALIELG